METISKMEIYKKKISREAMMRYVYSLSVIEDGYENMSLGLEMFLESTEEVFEEVYENVVGKKIPENKFINEFYDKYYMKELCENLSENIIKIDEQIDKFARKWSVKTMPKVDVSIMRLAICEIMYMQSIPTAVSIDEAIELAKRYCDDKSPSFINGVLGSIADSLK